MNSSAHENCEDSFTLAVKMALCNILNENTQAPLRSGKMMVAFSGGPDSTALLAALVPIAKENLFELHACHINHGLRGQESDDDEEFCRELCQKWNIPCHVEKLSLSGHSEAELRKGRYAAIERISARVNAGICLTGHTLDDQVETMLFRLFRGTGPSGLLGIPTLRRVSEKLILLRPLLSLTRQDCESFLERCDITARQDSSNKDECYARNFIRNSILPLVGARFGGVRQHFDQLRRLLDADESLLCRLAQDASLELLEYSGDRNLWSLDKFGELPLSLRRRVLLDALKQRNIESDFNRIESLLEMIDMDGKGAVSLNEQWIIRICDGELRWQDQLDIAPPLDEELSVPIEPEGLTLIHKLGLALKMEKINDRKDQVRLPGSQEHELIGDLSAVGQLKLRLREAGDQIQPLGMSCMVRLKKFLHTHKSTKTLSFGGRVLVLADDSEVLWVPGCGMSQRIAIASKATHRISLMRISPDETSFC